MATEEAATGVQHRGREREEGWVGGGGHERRASADGGYALIGAGLEEFERLFLVKNAGMLPLPDGSIVSMDHADWDCSRVYLQGNFTRMCATARHRRTLTKNVDQRIGPRSLDSEWHVGVSTRRRRKDCESTTEWSLGLPPNTFPLTGIVR